MRCSFRITTLALATALAGCKSQSDQERRIEEDRRCWSLLAPHLGKAKAALAAGDPRAALEEIDAVVALDPDPDTITVRRDYAATHEYSGEHAFGLVNETHDLRGEALLALGDLEGAEREYYENWRRRRFRAPETGVDVDARAEFEMVRTKRFNARLLELDRAVASSSGAQKVDALLARADGLLDSNLPNAGDRAQSDFEQAQTLAANDVRPIVGMARVHWKRFEREEAARLSVVALERAPELHWFPYFCLGSLADAAGESATAIKLMTRAVAIDGTRTEPRAGRARRS